MALLQSRHLPVGVRESMVRAGFAPRVKVLAWAATEDGAVCALREALVLVAGDDVVRWEWHEVLRVRWSDDGRFMRWTLVAEPDRELCAQFEAPNRLPEAVQERVEQTIVLRQSVTLAPGVVATVLARRPLRGEGAVQWTVHGPQIDALGLRGAAEREMARIKSDWG